MGDIMYLYHICREQDKGDTSKGYIGVSNNVRERWGEHKRLTTNKHLSNALQKYTDIVFYVLCKTTKDFALYLEEKARPVKNIGWNICKGGGMPPNALGTKHSQETINKLRELNTGSKNPLWGTTASLETIQKRLNTIEKNGGHPLKGKFGKDNPSFGRECTDEQKKLMSLKCKQRVYKQVTCNHCGNTGSSQAMGRWHFDNCRSK